MIYMKNHLFVCNYSVEWTEDLAKDGLGLEVQAFHLAPIYSIS